MITNWFAKRSEIKIENTIQIHLLDLIHFVSKYLRYLCEHNIIWNYPQMSIEYNSVGFDSKVSIFRTWRNIFVGNVCIYKCSLIIFYLTKYENNCLYKMWRNEQKIITNWFLLYIFLVHFKYIELFLNDRWIEYS